MSKRQSVEWVKTLLGQSRDNGVSEETKLARGLRHQRENFGELQFTLGRTLEIDEPMWDARILRRQLLAISDFADDLIDEALRTKDDGLKRLGCRIRAACTELREGIAEVGVPQVEAVALTQDQSNTMSADDVHAFAVEQMLTEQNRRRAELQGAPVEVVS